MGDNMDKIKKLINSLYLGDRFCERMEVSDNQIIIQINCISRIEEGQREWNYYVNEDIIHGCLIFDNISEYYANTDLEFNDEIYSLDIIGIEDESYLFVVNGCNVSNDNISTDIEYHIKAKGFFIFDPQQNRKILD